MIKVSQRKAHLLEQIELAKKEEMMFRMKSNVTGTKRTFNDMEEIKET